MPVMKSQILQKRDCGIHWGNKRSDGNNSCAKCAVINKHRSKHPSCYQAGGTVSIALLGEEVKFEAGVLEIIGKRMSPIHKRC